MIRGYVITADHETARAANVQQLLAQLPQLKRATAIYPSKDRVPFVKTILAKAINRKGNPFLPGELGVLLSNRRIWMEIRAQQNPEDHFLILESDSEIRQLDLLQKEFEHLTRFYDLFFWGAWLGNMTLKKSTCTKVDVLHRAGSPVLSSISGAYGYSLNKKAADHLLKKTGKLYLPVDEFKRYIDASYLRIGGIVPEVIAQGPGDSTIEPSDYKGRINWALIKLLRMRNQLIAQFS